MVAIGRQCLADPYLPKKYLEDKTEDIKWCICCDGCGELMIRQSYVGCVVHNPFYKARAQQLRKEQGRLGRIVTGDE